MLCVKTVTNDKQATQTNTGKQARLQATVQNIIYGGMNCCCNVILTYQTSQNSKAKPSSQLAATVIDSERETKAKQLIALTYHINKTFIIFTVTLWTATIQRST